MPANFRLTPNSEVIVPVSNDIFVDNDAKYAVGALGNGLATDPSMDEYMHAYLKLRGNVLGGQQGALDADQLHADGTETDEDDERSHHFVVVENMIGHAAVVACIRLILKSEEHPEPLPIERYYPEQFEDKPVSMNGLEYSRWMVRTPDRMSSQAVGHHLLNVALAHSLVNDLGPAYAIVERSTNLVLKRRGASMEPVTDVRYNDLYKEHDLGVLIDTERTAEGFGGLDYVKGSHIVEPGFKLYGAAQEEAA